MISFGEYILYCRMDKSMSMTKLASKLNMDTSTVSKIENGWRVFPRERLPELAKIFNKSIIEIENHYLNTDLKFRYGDIENYKERIIELLGEKTPNENLFELIGLGENKLVEFKSTLRFCLKSKQPEKYVEFSTIKNIAAFLNTNGGKLFIGIDDDGNVLGIENTDFITFKEKNKKDAFLKHLDNLISKYFGNYYSRNFEVKFKIIENKTIVLLDIIPNNQGPTVIKNIENVKQDMFYIRRNASAVSLGMSEFYDYAKERWS